VRTVVKIECPKGHKVTQVKGLSTCPKCGARLEMKLGPRWRSPSTVFHVEP